MEAYTLNGKEVLVVDVPPQSNAIRFFGFDNHLEWVNDYGESESKDLPPGDWQPLGKGSEISNDQWKDLVESDRYYDGHPEDHGLGEVTYYRDYPNELHESCIFSASESGLSWIRSIGKDPEKVYLLIKKEK